MLPTISAGVHTRVNITYLNSSGIPVGGILSVSDYVDDSGHASVAVTGTENETVYD